MNNFNNQGFTGQGFTQGFNNQASAQGFGGQTRGFGTQAFTNQTQGFSNQVLPNQGNVGSQNFVTPGFTNQVQGFGTQGFTNQTQGFGGAQQVNAQVIDRIHQNSIFGGTTSEGQNPQIQRIQQASLFAGGSQPEYTNNFQNPLNVGGVVQGFTNQASFGTPSSFGTQALVNQGNVGVQGSFGTQGFVNQGNVGTQGFTNQASFGGAQGFGGAQQVNAQVIDRIHQNSIFGGTTSEAQNPQIQRIQQASLFAGGSQPEYSNNFQNPLSVSGVSQGFTNQVQGFGGQTQGFGTQAFTNQTVGFGGQSLPNQGNNVSQNFGTQQGFGTQGFGTPVFTNQAQGFGGQQVTSQVIDRIHQNSLFNGASQFDNAQVARIQQNTISGNTPNPLSVGFGAASFTNNVSQPYQQQLFANHANNGTAFRAVMNADAGIRPDLEGPNSYPASMYTGSNQYDAVNQSVLNQVLGRQF